MSESGVEEIEDDVWWNEVLTNTVHMPTHSINNMEYFLTLSNLFFFNIMFKVFSRTFQSQVSKGFLFLHKISKVKDQQYLFFKNFLCFYYFPQIHKLSMISRTLLCVHNSLCLGNYMVSIWTYYHSALSEMLLSCYYLKYNKIHKKIIGYTIPL